MAIIFNKWQGGFSMYCNICGEEENNIKIFGINICKKCFCKIANISPNDEEYDKYKNLIRIILSYYISPGLMPYPVN